MIARILAAAVVLALAPIGSVQLLAQAPSSSIATAVRDTQPITPDSSFRDSAEVTDVARRHAGSVKHCYEQQGLKTDPSLRGLLQVELTVLPTGAVQHATATATNVTGTGMAAVAACVSAAAREWRFGDGAAGTERIVLDFDLLPPAS